MIAVGSMLWALAAAEAATLEDVWAAVSTRSHEAVLIEEQQRQMEEAQFLSVAALLPKVVLGSNVTFNQIEVAFDPSALFPPEITGLVEQLTGTPLELGDPILLQKKVALDGSLTFLQPIVNAPAFAQAAGVDDIIDAGARDRDAKLADLRKGVAQVYWAVLLGRAAEAVSKDALANAQQHRETVAKLRAGGVAVAQAELQAELAVSRAQRELAAASARRVVAERLLSDWSGLPGDAAFEEPQPSARAFGSLDAAVEHAWTHRAEVAAARLRVDSARTQHTVSMLGWVPTVDGRFTEQYTQNTGFSGRNWIWNAGIQLNWVAWDGGFRIVDTRQKASQVRMAEAAHERQRDAVRREVESAWQERLRAEAARAAVEREIGLATENLRLAEASLAAGVGTLQTAEDARLGLAAARLAELSERMNVHLADVALRHATGELRLAPSP